MIALAYLATVAIGLLVLAVALRPRPVPVPPAPRPPELTALLVVEPEIRLILAAAAQRTARLTTAA